MSLPLSLLIPQVGSPDCPRPSSASCVVDVIARFSVFTRFFQLHLRLSVHHHHHHHLHYPVLHLLHLYRMGICVHPMKQTVS